MPTPEEQVTALCLAGKGSFRYPLDGGGLEWRLVRIPNGKECRTLDTDKNEVYCVPMHKLANAISWDWDKRADMVSYIETLIQGFVRKIRDDQADFIESTKARIDPAALDDDFWYTNTDGLQIEDGELILVVRDDIYLFDDPTLRRSVKEGAYGWVEIGMAWLPPNYEITERDF